MIVREVTIGSVRLIQGDMRAVLPTLGPVADMVMTDPPYKLTSGGGNSTMRGCFGADRYDNGGVLFEIVDWADMAPIIFEAMAEESRAVIMSNDRNSWACEGAFVAAGLRKHRELYWDKGAAPLTPNFMQPVEKGFYFYKGRQRHIVHGGTSALVRVPHTDVAHRYAAPGAAKAKHATEKPVELMRHWISQIARPGEVVLDPFMGTGSTLVGAVRAGCSAIGVELDADWFDIAVARVRAEVEGCAQAALI